MANDDSITPLDRKTASKFNAFISACNTEESLSNIRKGLFDMGYMASVSDKEGMSYPDVFLYQFTNTICAALEYEQSQLEEIRKTVEVRQHG